MEEPGIRHVISDDGSSTLYTKRFGEHYHSTKGAVQESQHVFLNMGWHALPSGLDSVRILEMGFGTGLNALLTLLQRSARTVRYCALEAYPLPESVLTQLNYVDQLDDLAAGPAFLALHAAPWESSQEIVPGFVLEKKKCLLQKFQPQEAFELIYFDAFAPDTQPELWNETSLRRMYDWLAPEGIWVSYSAKGSVRRALIAAGLEVDRLPGPPGKREMLRARKPA